MTWIKNVLREIFGLFIDDGAFALAILVWLGVVHWAARYIRFSSITLAVILFVGLALILLESATRYARRKRTVKDETPTSSNPSSTNLNP